MNDEAEVLDGEITESDITGDEPETEEVPETDESDAETGEASDGETPDEVEVDPNKLPPELQKLYKGFQGSYTKKMQALQEAMEALTPHKERLAIMDRAINGDKEAMAHLARLAGKPEGEPQQKTDAPAYDYEDVPESFEDTRSLTKFMDNRFNAAMNNFMQYLNTQVLPQHLKPVSELQEKAQAESVQAQISEMRSKYPDFDGKIKDIIEVRKQNPGIGLEAAYKLTTWTQKVSPQKLVSKPGARPAAMSAKAPKEGISWEDAYQMAKERAGK